MNIIFISSWYSWVWHIWILIMIKSSYSFNSRQRQREPSTDSSISEDLDHSYGPSASEYIVTDVNHASYVSKKIYKTLNSV